MTTNPDLRSGECPATREAVWEQEEHGEIGCPLCGSDALLHRSEEPDASAETQRRTDGT